MSSSMKTVAAALAAWTLAVAPARADKKVDDAIARADQQLQRGHPEEGVKTLQRLAEQAPSAEAYAALARFQWKVGDAEGAGKSAGKAQELSASAPPPVRSEVLANVSGLTLRRGPGKEALAHAQEAVKAQETPSSLAALARAQVRTQQNLDRLSLEMREFKEEMREFKDEMAGSSQAADRRIADLAQQLGQASQDLRERRTRRPKRWQRRARRPRPTPSPERRSRSSAPRSWPRTPRTGPTPSPRRSRAPS